jgi:hypothetical protein
MMFWIISAAVVIVLAALAWWSSGRKRAGLDAQTIHTRIGKGQGDDTRRAGKGTGTNFMPGSGPFGGPTR